MTRTVKQEMDPRCEFLCQPSANKTQLPLDAKFTFSNEEKNGTTALHYWPARRPGPPEVFTLFVLGNPAVLDYYVPFLNMLHSRLPESHALVCTSHSGHDPRVKGPDVPLDLWENVETKVELVETLRDSLAVWAAECGLTMPRFNLMGHSIGAWLCVEVMKRIPTGIVDATYLLFPTLGWIANTTNGYTMWPVFHRPMRPILPNLAKFLAPALKYLPGMDDVTVSFINCPDSVRHVLSMARNEMEIVREPDFAWFGKQAAMSYASGVYSCWSAGSMDGWVGHEGPMVRERLGPDRYIQLEGVPHAFCLNDKDFPPVVEVCASWLTVHSKTPTSTIAGDITPSTSASGSGMSSGVSSGSSSGIRNGIMSAILSGRRSSDSGSARHSTDSAGRRSSTDSRRSNRSGRLRRIFNPSS